MLFGEAFECPCIFFFGWDSTAGLVERLVLSLLLPVSLTLFDMCCLGCMDCTGIAPITQVYVRWEYISLPRLRVGFTQ